jgi:restriction endonuclease S subunit
MLHKFSGLTLCDDKSFISVDTSNITALIQQFNIILYIYNSVILLYILYNVGGLLDQFCTNYTRYSTEDAVLIGNFFIYNPNHTSLQSLTIIYYAAMRLHNYNRYAFVTTVIYSTLARLRRLRALHFSLYCTVAHKVS